MSDRAEIASFPRPAMNATEWGLLIFLSVLWGGSFFFNHIAVAALPPFTVVAARLVLAACVLWLVVWRRGIAVPKGRAVWLAFLSMGVLNNAVPFSLIVWGQSHIASGVAAILNASTPVFGVVFAHWLTRDERLTPGRFVGVMLGLGGVAVMMGAAALETLGVDLAAQGACLLAAVSYALAGIYGRRFRAMGIAPIATATGQITMSSLILLPLALIVDQPWTLPMPGWPVIGSLIAVAVLSTALAYVVFFRLLGSAGATNLMLVTLLVPVTAILLGVVVLGEPLLTRHLVGMALIGLGLGAIDGRIWARLAR